MLPTHFMHRWSTWSTVVRCLQKHPYFKSRSSYVPIRYVVRYRRNMFVFGEMFSEHQWKVTNDSRTLITGAWIFLDRELLSVQLSFCGTQSYESVLQKTVFVTHECTMPFHQIFPLSSMGTCQVVVIPESLNLTCSIWWNNRNHFDGVFKEYLSGIHLHICFWK